jgi:hypothetical protein
LQWPYPFAPVGGFVVPSHAFSFFDLFFPPCEQLGDLGDTSTLTDPSVVDIIIQQHEELVNSKKA